MMAGCKRGFDAACRFLRLKKPQPVVPESPKTLGNNDFKPAINDYGADAETVFVDCNNDGVCSDDDDSVNNYPDAIPAIPEAVEEGSDQDDFHDANEGDDPVVGTGDEKDFGADSDSDADSALVLDENAGTGVFGWTDDDTQQSNTAAASTPPQPEPAAASKTDLLDRQSIEDIAPGTGGFLNSGRLALIPHWLINTRRAWASKGNSAAEKATKLHAVKVNLKKTTKSRASQVDAVPSSRSSMDSSTSAMDFARILTADEERDGYVPMSGIKWARIKA